MTLNQSLRIIKTIVDVQVPEKSERESLYRQARSERTPFARAEVQRMKLLLSIQAKLMKAGITQN